MDTQQQPGAADTKLTLESHVKGRGLLFEVDGESYILRPPTPAERDEASRTEMIQRRWLRLNDPLVAELSAQEPPEEEQELYRLLIKFEEKMMRSAEDNDDEDVEELERRINQMYSSTGTRTAADNIIAKHGRQCRNRYIAKACLCDLSLNPIDFNEAEIALQEEATRQADEMWDNIESLPFLSEQLPSLA